MPRLFFLACFLSITVASPIWAAEYDGQWRGVGTTKEQRARWTCNAKFNLKFTIVGNKITGGIKGRIDDHGRIKAKGRNEPPDTYTGTISRIRAQGTWRIIGSGCSGTWLAWRLFPPQTEFPEKIPGVAIREVAFTTGVKDAKPVDNLSEVSIDSGLIYILVKWKIDIDTIESFTVRYEVFDGKGDLVADRTQSIIPKTSTWNTWRSIPLSEYSQEPGEWQFVVYFNDHRAIESKLMVSPK